jgi:hypothetical protein
VALAIYANGFVNHVDTFAFCDSGDGALGFTGAAVDAFFIDAMWHFLLRGIISNVIWQSGKRVSPEIRLP